jgi:hypothetical protein
LLSTPFEVNTPEEPSGCFFHKMLYSYNTNVLGRSRLDRAPYCKSCKVVSDNQGFSDWSKWSSGTPPNFSRRFRKIVEGTCRDINWWPVLTKRACERAARGLNLEGLISETNLAERPEGCYYFRNYQDGTSTLWFNNNPLSEGKGAETGDVMRGMLRQPICAMDVQLAGRRATPSTKPTARYRKISSGSCEEEGGRPINNQRVCEMAAGDLGLVDTIPSVTHSEKRPEGCYLFRNDQDLSATLWLNLDPSGYGKGAETSDIANGLLRQPVCDMDSTSTVSSAQQFKMITTGRCTDLPGWTPVNGQASCEEAARELGLVHAGNSPQSRAIVASQGLESMPEGCYFYANGRNGTERLILNTNPLSKGNGAGNAGPTVLRRPICSTTRLSKGIVISSRETTLTSTTSTTTTTASSTPSATSTTTTTSTKATSTHSTSLASTSSTARLATTTSPAPTATSTTTDRTTGATTGTTTGTTTTTSLPIPTSTTPITTTPTTVLTTRTSTNTLGPTHVASEVAGEIQQVKLERAMAAAAKAEQRLIHEMR